MSWCTMMNDKRDLCLQKCKQCHFHKQPYDFWRILTSVFHCVTNNVMRDLIYLFIYLFVWDFIKRMAYVATNVKMIRNTTLAKNTCSRPWSIVCYHPRVRVEANTISRQRRPELRIGEFTRPEKKLNLSVSEFLATCNTQL